MTIIQCPLCGSAAIHPLNSEQYQCTHCGNTFRSDNQHQSARPICIHGYTQWFAVNPAVKVFVNSEQVGKVGKAETIFVNLDYPCQLKFECNLRTVTITVDPKTDTDVYLSWDRVSGCLLANKQNVSSANDNTDVPVSNTAVDKPNIGLDILSFLFPIVGFILFFSKRQEYPSCAKSYLICAICGVVISFLIMI